MKDITIKKKKHTEEKIFQTSNGVFSEIKKFTLGILKVIILLPTLLLTHIPHETLTERRGNRNKLWGYKTNRSNLLSLCHF